MEKLVEYAKSLGKLVSFKDMGNLVYQESDTRFVISDTLSEEDALMLVDLLKGVLR